VALVIESELKVSQRRMRALIAEGRVQAQRVSGTYPIRRTRWSRRRSAAKPEDEREPMTGQVMERAIDKMALSEIQRGCLLFDGDGVRWRGYSAFQDHGRRNHHEFVTPVLRAIFGQRRQDKQFAQGQPQQG
jgi:hypothetical protein